MKIKLAHYSRLSGAEGDPGEVIICPDEIGKRFIATAGAKLIEETPEPPKAPTKQSRKAKQSAEAD
jgi:hypothetical protein